MILKYDRSEVGDLKDIIEAVQRRALEERISRQNKLKVRTREDCLLPAFDLVESDALSCLHVC